MAEGTKKDVNPLQQAIFDYLHDNLSIVISDQSRPTTCGGDVAGDLGVRVRLYLVNPSTGKQESISSDDTSIG